MRPLQIHIKRKTRVPTKRQILHQYRSDWKIVGKLSYSEVSRLFSCYNLGGSIKTDAQFASFIKEQLGPGTYLCLAWCKGREGFFNFWKVQIDGFGFTRIPKNLTQEDKDRKGLVRDYKELKKKFETESDAIERRDLQKEMAEMSEEIDFDREIKEIEHSKSGPSPFLKQSIPIYRIHSYESYTNGKNEEVEENDLW
jgi:hypothetical protein